jgi:hypothetical protein
MTQRDTQGDSSRRALWPPHLRMRAHTAPVNQKRMRSRRRLLQNTAPFPFTVLVTYACITKQFCMHTLLQPA